MLPAPLPPPRLDPTPIADLYRGSQATELLVAAVAHFDLFGQLAVAPLAFEELRGRLGLAERPMMVLVTAMRAMGLVVRLADGRLDLTAMSREHLVPGTEFDIGGYLGLAAESAGVRELVELTERLVWRSS